MKVLLILSDGMRPDAMRAHPVLESFRQKGSCCLNARTVLPSVTLPCHMSLFHSVDPGRHAVTTNTFVPCMRPVPGLAEQLNKAGKKCAMYYNWEELRDLARPDQLWRSAFVSGHRYGYEAATRESLAQAQAELRKGEMDFVFLYLGWPDDEGHRHGWGSQEYQRAVDGCCDMVQELIAEFSGEYTIIYTADHGGHERMHGTDLPEDMNIPILFLGAPFEAGKEMQGLSIKDIAPTIAALLGAEIPEEWEGKILC